MRSDRRPAPTRERIRSRATDRIEDVAAWLLTAATLILVVAAGITGVAVHHRQAERAAAENAARWPTSAVLLEDAVVLTGAQGERLPTQVTATWTDRTGTAHTGMITATLSRTAGSTVDVWLDPDGRVVDPPAQPFAAVLLGAGVAGVLLALGGVLLYALWSAVRSFTAAANERWWEREWARVEPDWRSRHLR
jgi:hypothetical protein